MATAVLNGSVASVNGHAVAVRPVSDDGQVKTVEAYLAVKAEQREFEKMGRELGKKADALEKALYDQTESHGGMMAAGRYVLSIEPVKGTPAYKAICEEICREHSLPANTLPDKIEATPGKMKLVVVA